MLRFGPGLSRHLQHGRLRCSKPNASATLMPHGLLLNHHPVRGISINGAGQDHAVLRHERGYSDNLNSSSTLDACNNIGSSSHALYTKDFKHVDSANQRVPTHSNDQLQGATGYIKETDNITKEDGDVKVFRSTSSPNSCIHKIGAIHRKPNEIDTELWHRMNPSCIVKSRHMCFSQGSRQRTFARHASSLTANKFSAQSYHNQSCKQTHSCLNNDCTSSSFNPKLNCSQNNCNPTEDNAPLGKTILSDGTYSPPQPGSLLSVPVRGDNSESKSEASGVANGDKKSLEPLVPPDPETCCGSGCVNCVYIKYVQDVLERDPNDRGKVKDILDQIDDFNVKMFIKLELGL